MPSITGTTSSFGSSSPRSSLEDAYRRVGHRLSQRVFGADDGTTSTSSCSSSQSQSLAAAGLRPHKSSAFSCSQQRQEEGAIKQEQRQELLSNNDEPNVSRIKHIEQQSILKRVTYHAKDNFQNMRSGESSSAMSCSIGSEKRSSPTTVTNGNAPPQQQQASKLTQKDAAETAAAPASLLHSVLEAGGGSIHTTSTTTTLNNNNNAKCLTTPGAPVTNDGLDNADGNLICHEGDVIQPTPSASFQSFSPASGRCRELRVLSLLGQGTFAQVFECQCCETGDIVACKIVKNKAAYTRQAMVEIDVFRALWQMEGEHGSDVSTKTAATTTTDENMVKLECYFMYQNHLCLVFEKLGLNLYEVLKRRQFRGIPLPAVQALLRQAMKAVKNMASKQIVHCDLKPENILLSTAADESLLSGASRPGGVKEHESSVPASGSTPDTEATSSSTDDQSSSTSSQQQQEQLPEQRVVDIKLIDFGSACFEGQTAHSYIQSRFYRSPEVLVGLPYDSAIDMWSLGCVAAELFLGLPILPGVHEHDQLHRICEMIGSVPDWMLDQGSKASKYFAKEFHRSDSSGVSSPPPRTPSPLSGGDRSTPQPSRPTWRIKTRQEYIKSLSASEIRKKGGLKKLEKQNTNRYFKRTKLADIITLHGKHASTNEEKQQIGLFIHFLTGILDPDPWKRWTAFQASQHPFISGSTSHRRRSDVVLDGQPESFDIYWVAPWDPSICRRKLLNVQKTREKQQARRRNFGGSRPSQSSHADVGPPLSAASPGKIRKEEPISPLSTGASRITAMTDAMSLSRHSRSPPPFMGHSPTGALLQPPHTLAGSFGNNNGDLVGTTVRPHRPSYGHMSSSSLTAEYLPVVGSAAGMSYNEMAPTTNQQQPQVHGPQSYSGMSYDGVNYPVDADFGYALQRPGVVPGPGDLSSSFASNHPPPGPMAYSPHYLPQRPHQIGRSSSLTHGLQYPQSPGRFHYPYGQPTSIQEDATDYQLGGGKSSTDQQPKASAAGSSLLAQQLEQQQQQQATPRRRALHHQKSDGAFPAEVVLQQQRPPPQPYSYGQLPTYGGPHPPPQHHAGGYYTSYVAADGTPIGYPVPGTYDPQQPMTPSRTAAIMQQQHAVPHHHPHAGVPVPTSLLHPLGGTYHQAPPTRQELEAMAARGQLPPHYAAYNRGTSM